MAATIVASIGFAGAASASLRASTAEFTCAHFTDPTVELVWSHVCHDI